MPQDYPCLNCATFPKLVAFDVMIAGPGQACAFGGGPQEKAEPEVWHGQDYARCVRVGPADDHYFAVQLSRSWPDVEGKGLSLGVRISLVKGRVADPDRVAILVAIFESLKLSH